MPPAPPPPVPPVAPPGQVIPLPPTENPDGTYNPGYVPLQPVNPLDQPVVRDESVFFDGGVFTDVPRLSIPLHPIVYVTPQVADSQAERERSDPLFFSNPRAVQPGGAPASSIGAGLGMDPALFVQHAVRWSQARGQLLDDTVEGRLQRLSLGSDGRIPTPEWFEPDASQIVPELPGEDQPTQQQGEGQQGQQAEQRSDAKPAADSAPVQVAVRPAASPSFTEQLRNAGRRVPVPAGMAVRPAGSVPVSSSVS